MYTPVQTSFAVLKWGTRGYIVHGHVSLCLVRFTLDTQTPTSVFMNERTKCWYLSGHLVHHNLYS